MTGQSTRQIEAPEDEPVDPDAPHSDAAHDSPALERARGHSAELGGVLLLVAGVLLVTMLADPIRPWVQPFDDWVAESLAANRTAWATDLAKLFDAIGSTYVTVPIRIVAIGILVFRRRWIQLSAFTTALVLSELCIGPLKALVDRPRPPAIVEVSAASFPSGHAIAAAMTAFGLVVAFLPRGRRRLRWLIGATIFAATMAWSRTYLGAHWATDTLAGGCIGIGLAVLSEVGFEEARHRYARRAERRALVART